MFYPLTKTLGVYSGDKSSINYTFIQYTDYSVKGNIFWTGATIHNAVQEYGDFAPQEGISTPAQGIKIFISRGRIGNGGATPMFAKRNDLSLTAQYAITHILEGTGLIGNVIAVIKSQVDMLIGYRYKNGSGALDISLLTSDKLKTVAFHELTHAAQYAALGDSWYSTFVNAEVAEIINTFGNAYSPYGDGTNSNRSPIIALGESRAYHMGHYLADKRYTTYSSPASEQAITYYNNSPINGISSHLNLLEDFSPYRTADVFHWIPQGLYYDLNDNRNDGIYSFNAVTDQVVGYTNQQMAAGFASSVYNLQDYRIRLLQTTSNSTSSFVTNLFQQYGY